MKEQLFLVFRKAVRILGGRGLGLARIPGVNAVYRKVYAQLRSSNLVLVEVQGSKMYVKPDDSMVSASLITLGIWEAQETTLFMSLIKPGMTVLDIGANIGYYSMIAAKLVGAQGHVYAFEPDPENYQLIVKSAQVNGYRQVTAFNNAVADDTRQVELFLDSNNSGHSLSAVNVIKAAGSVTVEQVSLDDFYRQGKLGTKIDFIKIDVQGAEQLAMKGARRVIQECKPIIAMELEPVRLRNMGADPLELLRSLERCGYAFRTIESEVELPPNATLEDIVSAAEKYEKDGVLNLLLTSKN